MTVNVNDTIERYTVSGVGPYPFSFRIFADTDLQVTACSTATPAVPTLLAYLTHYTVTGANVASGGSVTLTASAAAAYAGYTLDIRSNTPNTQPTSIRNQGRFLPEIHEDAFDHIEREMQDLKRQLLACVRYPDNVLSDGTMTPVSAWVSKYLTTNASGVLTPAVLSSTVMTAAALTSLLTGSTTDQDAILALLMERTDTSPGLTGLKRAAIEISTGVTPSNYAYAVGDLRRYGVTDNDTDQTTQIVAALTAMGAGWDADLYIAPRIRFDMTAVMAVLPGKARLFFTNIFQSGAGYRQQINGVMSKPVDANTDTTRTIVDGHFPGLSFNNTRTAGTTSAGLGLCGLSWERGYLRNGTKGPRPLWQTNWTKSTVRTAEYGGLGVGCFVSRVRSPERAGNYEFWFNGITVAIGDYISATNQWVYRAVTAGVSTVSPTHSTGNATVGGITWAFESMWTPFKINFYYDELGRVGNDACDTGITQEWSQNPEDSENFTIRYTANGISKTIITRYRPSDGAAALVNLPYWEHSSANSSRLLLSDGSRVLAQVSDAKGLQLGQSGRISATTTNGATPSVASIARLVVSNAGATNVTGFTNSFADQEVELYFTNGNTTLVNSGTLALKGAVNVTPANSNIIVITRDPTNAAWVEKSRNF